METRADLNLPVEDRVWVRVLSYMSDKELQEIESQQIWVDLYEAAELTGYSVIGIRKVVHKMNRLTEEEREVKIRKRTSRWELWLPDILNYIAQPNRGPNRRSKE